MKPKSAGGLGFRDMELFNLALLAKQAWRVLQDPNSLSARILQSVYYPNSEFLEAELGSSPSKIWRSILDGREVLKEGLIRRIGNGESTYIWTMNWLPSGSLRRPIPTAVPNPPQLVSELINHAEASWDWDKLNQVFSPVDVDTIAGIPICTRQQDDFWAWHPEKRGLFTVRSAYFLLLNRRDQVDDALRSIPGRSDRKAEANEWKSLWSVRVPSKISIFLWRLARQSLPVGEVLHHRNMAQSSACFFCGGCDSWKHSLIECNVARCVWALEDDHILEAVCLSDEGDAKAWLSEIFRRLKHSDAVRVAVVLWAIWYSRRKAIHEREFQSPLSTHSFVERFLADLGEEKPKEKGKKSVIRRTGNWLPPPDGMIKINVDAAISKNECTASVAAIARDASGCFLGASALISKGITDPEVMEAVACREGLSLALDLQITRLRLASDNSSVVKNIRDGSKGVYGQVIEEVRARMTSFDTAEIVHERREHNADAHNIARSAVYGDVGRHVWLLNPPFGVCNTYTFDN